MTTLLYKQRALGRYTAPVLIDLSQGDGDMVTVKFEGYDTGELRFGGRTFMLRRGETVLRLSSIPDGTFTPKLIVEDKVYPLGELEVHAGRILSRESVIRELPGIRGQLITLSEELGSICQRLELLEEKIGADGVFKL